ncbi:MAG: cobalt transporter CbiM [Deltaproteobacteria bacterium]|nr:cobalt transporter CbiM [Candidatus Tharpella sp.]
MHIAEGVLSGPVLAAGFAVTVVGVGIGLKKLDFEQIAETGILAAAFFVASLVHVPIGPANVHLILNGIVGLLLGWAAFPAIATALLLQAVLFQFGGITSLGVNTAIMALPAIACHYLFAPLLWKSPKVAASAAFACGFMAVLLGAILLGGALFLSDENFLEVATIAVSAHIPVMVIEGFITLFCIGFLKKVRPEMLPGKPS